MPISVTEDLLRAVVTKDKALSDGRTLCKKGAFQELKVTADRSLLWGECRGSGADPYVLSIDLAGEHPTIRCTCPVKPPPCKHTLGLLVAFMEKPGSFAVSEPPAELIEKRAKNVERAEKRAEAATRPKEVNQAALGKKTRAQREALDLLEILVLDLATSGLGTLTADKADKLIEQARQMTDAYLPGAAEALRHLASLANPRTAGKDEELFYQLEEPGNDLSDELRHRLMTRHITRLWAMVRRGQKVLDDKLEAAEGAAAGTAAPAEPGAKTGAAQTAAAETEALVEDLLGHVWELAALTAQGYARRDHELFELADERWSDGVRGERIEQGFLLDLGQGDIVVDRKFRPLGALDKVKEKDSYEAPIRIREFGVYPGFINRRVRWEIAALSSRAVAAADFAAIHAAALPGLDAALARYKEQIRNPLAPDDAVMLVRAADIRRAPSAASAAPVLVLVDAAGGTLVLRDSALTRCRTVNTLAMAAGAQLAEGRLRQPASLLVRLYLGLEDDAIYGQPLALVVSTTHIRLGM